MKVKQILFIGTEHGQLLFCVLRENARFLYEHDFHRLIVIMLNTHFQAKSFLLQYSSFTSKTASFTAVNCSTVKTSNYPAYSRRGKYEEQFGNSGKRNRRDSKVEKKLSE